VIFDAGGVLHVSGGAQLEDLKQELGLSDEQLGRFYTFYLPRLGKGEITEEQLWQALQQELGIRAVTIEEHLLTRAFEKSLAKVPGMYELVDDLKSRGLILVLLTNVSPQYAEVLEQRGHYQPFALKVLSFEVGSWKPERKMFELALDKAGVTPGEAVFIDDQKKNVEAAAALGMHGIVFQDADQLRVQLDRVLQF
jgi:epoxide hydrolase-like predicted phosphatase